MNRRMIFNMIGRILVLEAALLLLPAAVAVVYREYTNIAAFGITIFTSAAVGALLIFCCKPKNYVIYAKDGLVLVALVWIFMSAIGAMPFTLSGEIPNFVDAFFETVSGFTTTGASILTDVERLSYSSLFWRSFTHWVGGMGVLVFMMAIVPNISDRSIHIMRAEMPGPVVGKLVPRAKDTAKILYLIYIVMTVLQIILLWLGDMNLFESVVHSLGTAGTGGFAIKNSGLAEYSVYSQWVITIFMLLFGINFNLYYMLLIRRFKTAFKSDELWTYVGIVVFSVAVITCNIYPMYQNFQEAFRNSAFQVASFITTTGYSTASFNTWPGLSKTVLLLLMFFGGCAGSTAGGIKISRVVLLFKTACREVRRMVHPRTVGTVRFEGKSVDEETISSIGSYLALYLMCMIVVLFLLSFEPFDFETNFSVTVSCFNNIGPAYGAAAANMAGYSVFGKIVLSFTMLFGRLEIYPLLVAFLPSTWSKK